MTVIYTPYQQLNLIHVYEIKIAVVKNVSLKILLTKKWKIEKYLPIILYTI